MPETRAQSNMNEDSQSPSLDNISQLIKNSTSSLQESFSAQLSELTNEIKKVNEILKNQQQDILSIRDVVIKKLQEENTLIKKRVSKLVDEQNRLKIENLALRGEISDIKKQTANLERTTYRTAEYTNYETVEISSIPMSIPAAEVPEVTVAIINALAESGDDSFGVEDFHAIHRRQGKFTQEKVLAKFVRRGDAFDTLVKAKKLRSINLTVIDERLIKPIYINEFLSPYYSKLRYACKLLKAKKLINDFWVSGHKVKVKTLEDNVNIISHKDDLIKIAKDDITAILVECKF